MQTIPDPEIQELWKRLRALKFPRSVYQASVVEAVPLILLDGYAAGGIMKFLSQGSLDQRDVEYLRDCKRGLEKALPSFDAAGIDSHGKEYFGLVYETVTYVLRKVVEVPASTETNKTFEANPPTVQD